MLRRLGPCPLPFCRLGKVAARAYSSIANTNTTIPKETKKAAGGLMEQLIREQRALLDPKNEKWSLFARNSPNRIGTGSAIRLTYLNSRTTKTPVRFTGVFMALRRCPAEPTILVRGIIDGVGVEQIFCLFSPLLLKIEVLKAAPHISGKKLYQLREQPAAIRNLLGLNAS